MHYFMSDIHGAEEAYLKMKEIIDFKANDELYILGDIFDGNDNNPKACLNILDDIMNHDNIHLILGDHEYAHVIYNLFSEDKEVKSYWLNYLLSHSAKPLLEYFYNRLTEKEKSLYISYLLKCEISDMIKIGNSQFYLVHGSPVSCGPNSMDWQEYVTKTRIKLNYDYKFSIRSDPNYNEYRKKIKGFNEEKIKIICGHIETKEIFEEYPALYQQSYKEPDKKFQKVILYKDKLLLNCGCNGNTIGKPCDNWLPDLSCIGIDAAGLFCVHLMGENSRYKRYQI